MTTRPASTWLMVTVAWSLEVPRVAVMVTGPPPLTGVATPVVAPTETTVLSEDVQIALVVTVWV